MGITQRVLVVLVLHIAFAHAFSWDTVVARSNKLEFYNEGTLAYTAAPASHRIKWIIYDPVHDRVLFADRRNSKLSASTFDIGTKIAQPLITKNTKRYFKRFAYDPATELLFGTRVNKIYSLSIKSGNNNVNGELVIDLESTIPREIAVDSCGGYIYWVASNTIERALFNGSDREVIIDKGLTVKQGLTIDTQKIYWIESQEYNEGGFSIESADLNGNNRRTLYSEAESDLLPDKLIVSKHFISWKFGIETAFVWQFPKNPPNDTNIIPDKISITSTANCSSYGFQDIAANYKIEERTQDVPNCHALKSLLPGYSDCLHATADGLFCVKGTKVSGESRCECTQGYIGERCDVSVCHNYCYQGDCDVSSGGEPKCRCNAGYSGERCHVLICKDYCLQGECTVSAEGEPICRCNAGYSGERCEASPCHDYCLNNGTCSLTNHNEPFCNCTGPYEGERCDVSICKDYCLQGECTVSAEGEPICRCNAGYYGERCEVSPCHDYCLNNGTCSLTNHNEPVCNCTGPYEGERCDVSICKDYCLQGECTVSAEGEPICRCNAGYSGERCEASACHDYCLNNGTCSLTNHNEPVCNCTGPYEGERCDVSICKDYCLQGECTVSAEGEPTCRCNAGYSGERCEASPCHDYCLNNGTCSLTNHNEPVCNCTGPYEGERCDIPTCMDYCFQGECTVSAEGEPTCRCSIGYTGERCHVRICENYCFQGECTVSAERLPKCRCNDGYSGKRCELNPCHDYCLNNGICSMNTQSKPVCQCTGYFKGERCEDSSKFHWLPIVNGELPPNAIVAGFEKEWTYIARAKDTTGSLCPGKYVPSHGCGYFPWGGKEHKLSEDNIEILCGNNAKWVKAGIYAFLGNMPKNAFIGGRAGGTAEDVGEPLYVGRGMIGNSLVVGKVYTSLDYCYLPYAGKEHQIRPCELLVEPDD